MAEQSETLPQKTTNSYQNKLCLLRIFFYLPIELAEIRHAHSIFCLRRKENYLR